VIALPPSAAGNREGQRIAYAVDPVSTRSASNPWMVRTRAPLFEASEQPGHIRGGRLGSMRSVPVSQRPGAVAEQKAALAVAVRVYGSPSGSTLTSYTRSACVRVSKWLRQPRDEAGGPREMQLRTSGRPRVPLQPGAPHTLTAQPLLQRECEGGNALERRACGCAASGVDLVGGGHATWPHDAPTEG
jgi:hypothetical protein